MAPPGTQERPRSGVSRVTKSSLQPILDSRSGATRAPPLRESERLMLGPDGSPLMPHDLAMSARQPPVVRAARSPEAPPEAPGYPSPPPFTHWHFAGSAPPRPGGHLARLRPRRRTPSLNFHWAPVPKSPPIARKLRRSGIEQPDGRKMDHSAWECGFRPSAGLPLAALHTREVAGSKPAAPIGS
jgi:hypothetical protein